MSDAEPTGTIEAHLDVHPSVVFKLGEDLITDDVQALAELMKNAYDADSPSVTVRIDTHTWTLERDGTKVSAREASQLLALRRPLEQQLADLEQRARSVNQTNQAISEGPHDPDQVAAQRDAATPQQQTLDAAGPEAPEAVNDADKIAESAAAVRESLNAIPRPLLGYAQIEDTGSGMTVDDIINGWLKVSISRKRELKATGKTTKGGRTPLGDKGLGRLGAQRLGAVLDLLTRADETPIGLSARIVWSDFDNVDSLGGVAINIEPRETAFAKGSIVTVRGLHDIAQWRSTAPAGNPTGNHTSEPDGPSDASTNPVADSVTPDHRDSPNHPGPTAPVPALGSSTPTAAEPDVSTDPDDSPDTAAGANTISDIERELATMISPYGDELGFRVRLTIDGVRIDLREQSREVLRASAANYSITYNDQQLVLHGKASSRFLRPDRRPEVIAAWDRYIAPDNGFAFLNWLLETQPAKAAAIGLVHGDDQYFCHFERRVDLNDTIGAERDEMTGKPVDPGPFDGRVDVIQLRSLQPGPRQHFEALHGVRLYRNGFNIRVPDNWLDFAAQWTSGKSYYTIRPENVVGVVNLTTEHNAALEETSDREAFRDTPAYRNFSRLFGQWLKFTEEAQSLLRRQLLVYARQVKETDAGVGPDSSPIELAAEVKLQLESAKASASSLAEARTTARKVRQTLESSVDLRQGRRNRTTDQDPGPGPGSGTSDPADVDPEYEALDATARETLDQLDSQLEAIHTALAENRSHTHALELLLERVQEAERQVEEMWEVMSLGLTAETIAHEVKNITDRMIGRSAQIARYNDTTLQNGRITAYVENMRASARSLAKQVSHLDTSLRYVRDDRRRFQVGEFLTQTIDYFNLRWDRSNMKAELHIATDINVRASQGKFSQVFDNLLLNSEYWMQTAIESGTLQRGTATITIDWPYVTIEDNGPGIDPNVANIMFDPFVTRKPKRAGRGLGLYVVRQLLETEKSLIYLDPETNEAGRRYKFRIDLSECPEASPA